jgi:hypothetical protein
LTTVLLSEPSHKVTSGDDRLKRRHNTVYRTLTGDSRSDDSAIVDNRLLQEIKGLIYATYIRVKRHVYFQSTTS